MIEKAITFATVAHHRQKRKGSNIPYIFHPLEAGNIVAEMSSDENLIVAAILHDTIEDTGITYSAIYNIFGERIANLVKSQSEDKSKTWKERKTHTIEFLQNCSDQEIKIVTLADKLSNVRALQRDYSTIGEKLWERFNVKDKEMHEWYYNGLVSSLESLKGFRSYKEFKNLVINVFG
jgi:myo-inositol-1(or 4)-monophosphatase